MSSVYDHTLSILSLDGHRITDYTGSATCLQFNPVGEKFTREQGFARSFINRTPNNGVEVVIELMQGSDDSKFLQNRLNSQLQNIATHVPIQGFYKDLCDKEERVLTDGYILVQPSSAKGGGHNPKTWTIVFDKEEIKQG